MTDETDTPDDGSVPPEVEEKLNAYSDLNDRVTSLSKAIAKYGAAPDTISIIGSRLNIALDLILGPMITSKDSPFTEARLDFEIAFLELMEENLTNMKSEVRRASINPGRGGGNNGLIVPGSRG